MIIDDDFRNIVSLASMLEACGLTVLHADSGRGDLEVLRRHPEVDVNHLLPLPRVWTTGRVVLNREDPV